MISIEQEIASISFDMEGDPYFMVGDIAYYLNEFMKTDDDEFDGITHITNTGGMGINIDEANEQVKYTIFTIAPFTL